MNDRLCSSMDHNYGVCQYSIVPPTRRLIFMHAQAPGPYAVLGMSFSKDHLAVKIITPVGVQQLRLPAAASGDAHHHFVPDD